MDLHRLSLATTQAHRSCFRRICIALPNGHLSSVICYSIRATGENDVMRICHHDPVVFTPRAGLPKRSMLRTEREFRRRLPADQSLSAPLPLAAARCIVFAIDE
jgi:hypothetical protein